MVHSISRGEAEVPVQFDHADVVVIGGGIVGVSTAWFLAEQGLDVVLVEQRRLAFGASGRNVGYLLIQVRNAGFALELARAGRALYNYFAEELGNTFEYRSNGGMIFSTTDAQHRVLTEFVDQRRADGLKIELLDGRAAREAAPILTPKVTGATYCAEDGQIRTALFVESLAGRCRQRGVRIYEGVTATGLIRHQDAVRGIRTVWGSIPAGAVVWCGGAWHQFLADEGIAMPVQLERLGAMLTEPVTERLDKILYGPLAAKQYGMVRSLPSFNEADFRSGFEDPAHGAELIQTIAQTADGRLLLGCPMDYPETIDHGMPASAVRMTLGAFAEAFPQYGGIAIERVWSGVLAATADSLPVLGPVDGLQGLFAATGFIYGNVAGPISGKLLSEMVSGDEPSMDVRQLSFSRPGLRAETQGAARW